MFTKIIMKNFRSFESVSIDLTEKKDIAKRLAVIYGENGSGKTTLAYAIMFLSLTMETMQIKQLLNGLLTDNSFPIKDVSSKESFIKDVLSSNSSFWGLDGIINQNKMIGSQSNMSIEYHFVIDGNSGMYYIETDDTSVIKERLEFKLSKRRGCYFDLNEDEIKVNKTIFKTKEAYNTVLSQVKKYWGKHSLLSILKFETFDKSASYIDDSFTSNLIELLLSFSSIKCFVPGRVRPKSGDSILDNLKSGSISESENEQLCTVEKSLCKIFKSIYNDIVDVYYKRNYENGKIEYELFLKKRHKDKIVDIEFDRESSGTKQILRLIPAFAAACAGQCVVIDEYGVRIHDLLAEKILNCVMDQVTGQLIITTHNTTLMESTSLPAESLYFIKNNHHSNNKSIDCITQIEKRLYPNYNYRNRYFHSPEYKDYLPDDITNLDFSELIELI